MTTAPAGVAPVGAPADEASLGAQVGEDPPWLGTALIAEAAVFAGIGIGALVGLGLPLTLVLGALLAPVLLLITIISAEAGLLLLIGLVYTNASDVLIGYGLPNTLQPLMALLVLTIALRCAWRRSLPRGLLVPGAMLGVYGMVLSLSLFFAANFETAFLGVSDYAKDALLALLVVALLRTARSLERVLWLLVAVGFFLAAVSCYQYVTGSFGQTFGGFAQAKVQNIAGGTDDYRVSGPIGDPNHFAQVLIVLAAIALGRMRAAGRVLGRLLAGSTLLLLGLTIVFTFSRGALVALVVLLTVAVVRQPPPLPALLGGVLVVLITVPALPPGYGERFASLADALPGIGSGSAGEASISGRYAALRAGQQMALSNPVLGVGVGQFTEHFREYSLGLGLDTPNGGLESHNLFLQVVAETGLLGLLGFCGLLLLAAWRLRQGRSRLRAAGHHRHAVMLGDLELALLGYLLAGMFVHLAYERLLYALLGVCFAVPFVVRDLTARPHTAGAAPAPPWT